MSSERRRLRARPVTERAKLYRPAGRVFTALVVLVSSACVREDAPTAVYDRISRRLIRLDADTNRDGHIDQRTYLNGNIPIRAESDLDADGRVDRWEYFDRAGALAFVGTSSISTGPEDSWTWAEGPDGQRRVDRSRARDRRIDRREFYRGDTLTRAEEDSDGNGVTDKWEVFEAGTLRQVTFDTNHDGRPDRRLLYESNAQSATLETDDDGDGQWQRVIKPADRTAVSQSRPK